MPCTPFWALIPRFITENEN
uniref:Uncharacterized protein n=1 Tax=Anguilla anguilla TaxID=7936 RepID=A0A0E9RM68_ANGAN